MVRVEPSGIGAPDYKVHTVSCLLSLNSGLPLTTVCWVIRLSCNGGTKIGMHNLRVKVYGRPKVSETIKDE